MLLYFPLLDNAFLSDDFRSLHRILIEKRILYKEVFRPLIDISFYINYLLSGLNPASYYVVNILVHCLSAYMVFRVSLRCQVSKDQDQLIFAALSGFFFLIYPFHNESVAWLTGRLSSIAGLCALIILYWSMEYGQVLKYFILSVLVFLFALTGYESIIFLPAILLVWNWQAFPSKKKLAVLFLGWIGVIVFYIVGRYIISGKITSDYGSRVLNINSASGQFSKLFKAAGRLFLPPMQDSNMMIVAFAIIGLLLIVLHFVNRKNIAAKYWTLVLSLLISLILPASFGVSTKTSEGDRLLYFPSVFLCMILSFWIIEVFSNRIRLIAIAAVAVYFITFLSKNIHQWELASGAVKSILKEVKENEKEGVVFVNMPEEINGAFVFRQGFEEALGVYGFNSANVTRVDSLSGLSRLHLPGLNPVVFYWDGKVLNKITLPK